MRLGARFGGADKTLQESASPAELLAAGRGRGSAPAATRLRGGGRGRQRAGARLLTCWEHPGPDPAGARSGAADRGRVAVRPSVLQSSPAGD